MRPTTTAGTDIKVLVMVRTNRLPGKDLYARRNAIAIAGGEAIRIARKETENETPMADQTSLSPVSSMEKAEIRAELESNNTF